MRVDLAFQVLVFKHYAFLLQTGNPLQPFFAERDVQIAYEDGEQYHCAVKQIRSPERSPDGKLVGILIRVFEGGIQRHLNTELIMAGRQLREPC